jgi:hypothetical protein
MVDPELVGKLHHARRALDEATCENVVERCGYYVELLAVYANELYRLPDTLGINGWLGPFLLEDVGSIRKAIRVAIENTTLERKRAEALLLSLATAGGQEVEGKLHARRDGDDRARPQTLAASAPHGLTAEGGRD